MSQTPGIDLSSVRTRIFDIPGIRERSTWFAAYSGGVDSTVLLHILAAICRDCGNRLIALHADHGLHDLSSDWRRHCERQCREWDVECLTTSLDFTSRGGRGPEGNAREARYRWFFEMAGPEAWVFTAHHRGDQAETVIERMTRGAGPRGLRGMLPATRLFGVRIARPLLDVPRASIEAYANQHRLRWVTDRSNSDLRFTRNYIRRRVLPVLEERWPSVESALAAVADAMREAQAILDEGAAGDLAGLDERVIGGDPSLRIPALTALPLERQRNALHYWVQRELGISLGRRRLDRAVNEVGRFPESPGGLRWPPVELRGYRDRLYLAGPRESFAAPIPWDLRSETALENRTVLRPRMARGRGLRTSVLSETVTVDRRRGGEKCRLRGRPHRRTLKKILQEAGIPPWQRPDFPLVLVNGQLAAIPGVDCCEPYAAGPDEDGIEVELVQVPRPPGSYPGRDTGPRRT